MARCQAIKANGERCSASAAPGVEWCWNHDPAHAEQRRRNASKGGRLRHERGSDLRAIRERVEELAEQVISGELDKGRAAVAGQLYNVAIRCRAVELQEREQLELVERLERLEAELEVRERSDTWGSTTG